MANRTKSAPHPITVPLSEPVHAALVKAAKKDGRSTRAHAARLIAVALGLACLALAGCSGSPVSPLGGHEMPGQVCADGGCQPCGGAGEACCDDDTTGMTFATDAGVHGGGKNYYCSESAGVPCSKRLLCEACGGKGEQGCGAALGVDAGATFPQPDFCEPGLALNEATATCEACGGHGQACCTSIPVCSIGECGGEFLCP